MASTSSSSIQMSFKYDVFLSFRGEDTRNNFVGHLYQALTQKRIITYKDDKEIEQGKTINDQLLKSIEESRFYIIVFSKTYASSSWCLNELVKIMECKKTTEQNVYPVFFDVEPTEVRKQSGAVKEAFAEHEKKEAAGKWREAMEEASNLAGWELKATANGNESELIKIIVDVIFKKKYSTLLNVDGKLVGMETRISDILSSLEIGTEDVRMIGIKGIGGGGKTTLAEAVCDQISLHFEGISFVENVRVVSKETSPSGLKMLQKQILADVLNKQDITVSSVHDGKRMMANMMRGTKVLIVLDDVDHKCQLEALAGDLNWFKSGSRIIITTRDEQVLVSHGVSLICNVNLLTDEEAICLFRRYASGNEILSQGCNEMSRQVVRYAAGLPLTVKVLGSSLCGKNDLEWKDALERLKKVPEHETQEILKISYDALENDYKEIFLDVACILKGEQKDKAIRVLESCGFHASIGLSVLEKKSLITISKYGSLGMHDRIEEMGKYLDCHLHPDEHNRHSRLWIVKEIEDILASNLIDEAIRCIKLLPQRLDLRAFMTGLRNMKKVRVLYMCSGSDWDDSNVSQLFPSSLKYLCWRAYPFSSLHETFQADNLVGLDMSFSTKLQLWLVGKGKALTKLRFLDLSYTGLGRLNLGLTPNLESLDLKECWNLVEVNAPVGCLKNLLYMDLSGCGITEVPKDLQNLLHLEELYLSKTKIKYLPDSICMLKQLKSINLEDCHNLEKLPDDFGQLDSLEELILSNSKIKHLPDSVCMLKQLKSLKLQGCGHLEKLPKGFGHLECLKELNITGTAVSHLPQYIFGLKGVRIIGSKMMLGSFGFTSEIQSSDHETFVDITGAPKQELVGMETRIRDVVSSLEINVDDVRMLGIWGMGGAGKTTLAKAVFDQISFMFEGKSFVENVREESKPSLSGLKSLQKQVLSDISNDQGVTVSGPLDGKNKIKKAMGGRKVLLVLDDVNHKDQLESLAGNCNWFKPGSRIIITTRDKQVPAAHGVGLIHNVTLLSQAEAGCLFSRHAFGRENPIQGYEELSRKVLQYADGLPLTIKVMGSHLRDLDESEWKNAIKRLEKIPVKDTMEVLEISFDGLDDDHKEIFLDVACILKGWGKEDAIRVLESRGFHAIYGLRVLEQKSLITISESNWEGKLCLGMHDHLEEMGRNIVRRSHPDEPQRHSRLWVNEEIEDILTNDLGTQATKCLYFHRPWGFSAEIAVKGLAKMKDLRFIHINLTKDYYKGNIVRFHKVSEYLPSSLRFMRWDGFLFSSLPNTFQGKYLVGLHIRDSNIVQLWEDGEEKVLHKLRFLKITDSNLRTFDLRLAPNLERLTISRCYNFEELHMPAHHHSMLKYLDLRHSKLKTIHLGNTPNLEELVLKGYDKSPNLNFSLLGINTIPSKLRTLDLGLTPNLKRLNLKYCYDLVEINAPIGCLKKLVFLDLSGCGRFKSFVFDKRYQPSKAGSLSELHLVVEPTDVCPLHSDNDSPKFRYECSYKEDKASSFGNLERLISMGLCACTNLENFSRGICSLRGLRKLTLEGCITEAPRDLDQLECLEELTFSSTEIKHLPDSICKLKHLKSFEIKSCWLLEKLPVDIGRLESLEKLILTDCKLLQDIPNSICKMKCINELRLCGCIRVVELPEDIGSLEGLKELNTGGTGIIRLPQSIFQLRGLRIVGSMQLLDA